MAKKKYNKRWNFQNGSMNELNHLIHPYPAMLMPLIVRELLKRYGNGSETVILDPYVGSGTTLVEGMLYGAKEIYGIDLNPLALLICKAKTVYFDLIKLTNKISEFRKESRNVDYDVNVIDNDNIFSFSIRNSWFKEKNIIELDFIKKFIDKIKDSNMKLYFQVSFSQTIRRVSLTRNGEFKLYRIPQNKIQNFNPNAIEDFLEILSKNMKLVDDAQNKLNYNTEIQLHEISAINLLKLKDVNNKFDLIITSPPYGDSHTTVAYGQFSRLANEWLGISEANQIDKKLLGGRKTINLDKIFDIKELDEVIKKIKKYDSTQKRDRYRDVISFYDDYICSINSIAKSVKINGYAIYVVGNRRVRNFELPTDIITARAFEKNGFEHLETIVRDIINKRMPSKASPSNRVGGQISTMTKEYIVIMKKVE